MGILLVIAGLLVVLALFQRHFRLIIASLFGKSVGQAALAQQPDEIHLTIAARNPWANPIPEGISAEMVHRGFKDAGTFTVPEMPGVVLRLLAHEEDSLYAAIYQHPRGGTWFDYVCEYQNGTGAIFTTCAPTGLDPRPGYTMENAPGASASGLLDQARTARPKGALKPASVANAVTDFERAYTEYMAWRRGKGISKAEVMRVAARKAA